MSDVTITTYEGTEVDAEHFGYTITVTQGAGGGGEALESYVDQIETLDDYPATFPPASHNHDDRYYTEAEVDTALAAKATTAALAAHEADTTSIHGIADTSLLETQSGAQTKATAAQAAAEATAAAALTTHAADTTSVHGIADTANLILEGDSRLTNSRAPSGAAGGVLSGTYPNPGFAADMATQAELDAEAALARNADNLTSGTVADARIASTIARDSEVTAAIAAHVDDATDAHDASAVSFSPTGAVAATDVQAAIAELDTEKATTGSVTTVASDLAAHLADTTDAHDASAISFTPTGTIAATDVQAAIAEVAAEAGGGGATDLEGLSDVDLTAEANDDFLQRKGGVFVNRTVAQVKTDLALPSDTTTSLAGKIDKSTLDANTILYATTDDTPAALPVAASRIVGRKATGDIDDMTTAEVAALFGTPDGTKFLADDGTLKVPSGGGGGGSVATDTIFDAKGDLAVGTGADTAAKLTVGANGLLLVADSSQSTGLKYAAPGPLAYVTYNPGSIQTTTTTSTTPVDVDATNLAVTFNAPASGIVLVALSGFTKNNATDKANLWYLRNGSTTMASRYAVNNFYPIGVTVWMKVTGLTGGSSYTFKWAHSTESGSTAYLQYGGVVGDAVMVVWGG